MKPDNTHRMKAISLWQPWASLMVLGKKKIETRSWHTNQRGLIAIHAAKKWNKSLETTCFQKPFYKALTAGYQFAPNAFKEFLPFGAILGIGELIDCEPITRANFPKGDEHCFGDYTPGRFMWLFKNIKKLPKPLPYKGAQGFFKIDQPTTIAVLQQLID